MSVGWGEILVLLIIALLVFGPARLPELAKSLGRAVREFKRAVDASADDEKQPTTSKAD